MYGRIILINKKNRIKKKKKTLLPAVPLDPRKELF